MGGTTGYYFLGSFHMNDTVQFVLTSGPGFP